MTFSVALLSILAVALPQTLAVTTNDDCTSKLTELDPHMSRFIGKSYVVQGVHTDKEYEYHVGVCVDVEYKGIGSGCAVAQVDSSPEQENTSLHCIGKTGNAQVARSSDGEWIELTYTHGESYGHHCQQGSRTARIVFLCDTDIPGTGHLDFLEENRDDNLCYYLFSLAASAVCGYTNTPAVSWGDVILIIFACLLGLWLVAMVLGCLYKRFMMGAKGWEQMPMTDFYREFGNLEADGCDLVCRTQPLVPAEYKEPTFGADTDDEEEKDDNLLPM